ncbi:sigma-54-dependent transcriptional regulator [Aquabacterium sp.]|uniref:sigma-54-dependent transcriptional regulator n=1 Tax=Aquabacterium sp. TaxID=1872578 RepID=UPI002B9C20D4|nr:sigma-54 dependent transcriptional regulator [Aquabacterium sp.]HSW04244.1 sigma-54 dependent transcriptional regulator [Aquabacterium sp.]
MFEGFKVLFVEDDSAVRSSLGQALRLAGLELQAFVSAEEALRHVVPGLQGIVISDVRLPRMDGLALLKEVRRIDPDIPVTLITGHGDVALAVEAMHAGAYDFIEKPFMTERFVETAMRAMEKRVLRAAVETLRSQLHEKAGIEAALLGQSPAMLQVRAQVLMLAETSADVMIVGETGCGKELVARCLHDHSRRRDRNFVAINCAGLPDSLLESELFGHEAGAFTSASKRRIGKIEHANGGTLMLDEIESMPLSFQAKLLRVLQERKVERLGSNDEQPVDIRVIAASKSDLLEMSRHGTFRSDLYYRLNVAVLNLPPLRERREDVPLLFQHFVLQAAKRYEREAPEVSGEHMHRLMAYDWPGNVREVRNAADRFVLKLPNGQGHGQGHGQGLNPPLAPQGPMTLTQQMDVIERALIENALKQHEGCPSGVVEALGIGKKTLYEKLRRHNITIKDFR